MSNIDPATLAEINNSLSVFERVASRIAVNTSKSMMTENYPHSSHNMLTEQNSFIPQNQPIAVANGLQHGRFGIFPITSNGKTRYDVADMASGQKVVGELFVMEAANYIAKKLNENYSFYSPQIRTVLELEQKYVKQYNDAIAAKRLVKDTHRDALLENKFNEAKTKAVNVKQVLLDFIKKN